MNSLKKERFPTVQNVLLFWFLFPIVHVLVCDFTVNNSSHKKDCKRNKQYLLENYFVPLEFTRFIGSQCLNKTKCSIILQNSYLTTKGVSNT